MENLIEINIEIDTSNKEVFIGEENCSGVEYKYDKYDEIPKYFKEYIETYHKQMIEDISKQN